MDETIVAKIQFINDKYINTRKVSGVLERKEAYHYFFCQTFTKPEAKRLTLGFNPSTKAISINLNSYLKQFHLKKN